MLVASHLLCSLKGEIFYNNVWNFFYNFLLLYSRLLFSLFNKQTNTKCCLSRKNDLILIQMTVGPKDEGWSKSQPRFLGSSGLKMILRYLYWPEFRWFLKLCGLSLCFVFWVFWKISKYLLILCHTTFKSILDGKKWKLSESKCKH